VALHAGRQSRRRPPILTRDHVARINREVKAAVQPHGGVFLDIAWIRKKIPGSADHIKRKLPSMYHQFKQLAALDITAQQMEIGPTTHYTMGGIRVDGDTQMSTLPGLFAAGEAAAGLHGANRLGGNSLSDLIVFGKRAGNMRRSLPGPTPRSYRRGQVDTATRQALAPPRSRRGRREPLRDPV
jgi:succinate dehydrogenase / fumarate reductase flavoprotein subunit